MNLRMRTASLCVMETRDTFVYQLLSHPYNSGQEAHMIKWGEEIACDLI